MPGPDDARNQLKEAIHREQAANLAAARQYEALTERMKAYQLGTGPAPTFEDFLKWNEAVKQRVILARLNAGLTEDDRKD